MAEGQPQGGYSSEHMQIKWSFLQYEELFHNFKSIYFKVFGPPVTTPFWQTREGVLKINCYWNKDFNIPSVDENDLSSEERAAIEFFLMG